MEEKINSGVTRTGETDIRLNLIDSFPNHPYHVFDDEDMTELAASIEANGLLNPIIVRSKADGRYELISGHRRKRAYEILKIKIIRAIIVDVSDDEAIIMMVDSKIRAARAIQVEVLRHSNMQPAVESKLHTESYHLAFIITKRGKENLIAKDLCITFSIQCYFFEKTIIRMRIVLHIGYGCRLVGV